MQHAAISQSTMKWFSSGNWTPAYNLCLRAGRTVMVANLDISGLLTMTLSAPESHNLNSHVGTLSFGLCQNHCTISINSVGVYDLAVTWKCDWAGGHWLGSTPAGLSCTFLVFWVITGRSSNESVISGASKSALEFLFPCSTRSVVSKICSLSTEILWTWPIRGWKVVFFPLIYSAPVLISQCGFLIARFHFLRYQLFFQLGLGHAAMAMPM